MSGKRLGIGKGEPIEGADHLNRSLTHDIGELVNDVLARRLADRQYEQRLHGRSI